MRQNFAGSGVVRAGLFHLALFALVLASVLVPGGTARANIILGDYLGTFAGNDSETALLNELGLQVTELAKAETPPFDTGDLKLSEFTLDGDSKPILGRWDFDGAGVVDFLVVKAGNEYAVFQYSDINTSFMRNLGLWNTSQVGGRGMSHITAYQLSAVPLPAALPLLGSALASLGFVGWRRRRDKAAKTAAA